MPSSRSMTPIKIGVGKQNIRVDATGSAATLGRQANAAFSEIADNLQWFVNQLEGYLPEDLRWAMEPTFELSQKYCPVETGDLLASGYLEVEGFRGGARVEIGYGKNNFPDYAIYVHEMPHYHVPPTSDKFLQKAIDEDYYNILQRVTDSVKARSGN